METTFYIVRHGSTQFNHERVYSGRTIDIPLTEEGEGQARVLADALKTRPIEVVYSSPLTRARQTATIIQEANQAYRATNVPLSLDARLMELHMGILEGIAADDARSLFSDVVISRAADMYRYQIRGGQSYEMLVAQVRPFVEEVKSNHYGKEVCIVGHQGVNRALLGILRDLQPEAIPKLPIPQNVIYTVTLTNSDVKDVIRQLVG